MGAFIHPFTDWGFKRIFGDKQLLIEFLNDLLQGERVITDIRYMNNERAPEQMEQRKVIYDIFCETDTGGHIIVEMQNRWQEHFRDRALYYMAKSIVQQAEPGRKWDFKLTAVYGIFFVNFSLDRKDDDSYFCKDVAMIEKRSGKVFNDKLRQIYIELPRFMKAEKDCENFFECWIYNLVNMDKLERISFKDQKAIFGRLEQIASQANLTKEERARFENEWKIYNDYFNVLESAEKKARMEREEARAKGLAEGRAEGHAEGLAEGRAEGKAEGRAEGKAEGKIEGKIEEKLATAYNLKVLGVSLDVIMKATGLSAEEVERL